jgi:hypothetical protein
MSSQDSIDTAHRLAVEEVVAETTERGQKLSPAQLLALAHSRLCQKWLESGNYDDIIDFFTSNSYGQGGFQYFVPLSKRLVQVGDKPRLVRLWRTVIGGRKSYNSPDEAISGMRHFAEALEELGDIQLANRVRQECELYSQGKQLKLPKPDKRSMDESVFWELIDGVKNSATSPLERPWQLTEELQKFSATAIKQFEAIFQQKLAEAYRQDLWAIAYIALGGCSNDDFEYFLAWLVSEGKQVFEAALEDPESLAGLDVQPFKLEAMLYASLEAYDRRANKPLNVKRLIPKQPAGRAWEEADLSVRFPNACRKWGCQSA